MVFDPSFYSTLNIYFIYKVWQPEGATNRGSEWAIWANLDIPSVLYNKMHVSFVTLRVSFSNLFVSAKNNIVALTFCVCWQTQNWFCVEGKECLKTRFCFEVFYIWANSNLILWSIRVLNWNCYLLILFYV